MYLHKEEFFRDIIMDVSYRSGITQDKEINRTSQFKKDYKKAIP